MTDTGREATEGLRHSPVEVLLQLDQLFYAVVHLRHGLDLRQPQASLVGDVVHPALTLPMLASRFCQHTARGTRH